MENENISYWFYDQRSGKVNGERRTPAELDSAVASFYEVYGVSEHIGAELQPYNQMPQEPQAA